MGRFSPCTSSSFIVRGGIVLSIYANGAYVRAQYILLVLGLALAGLLLSLGPDAKALTAATVAPTTTTAGTYTDYRLEFAVGAAGALTGGTHTITIAFPAGTVISSALVAGDIKVNDTAVTAGLTVSGTSMTFTTPVSVANDGTVTVMTYNIRIANPTKAANYTLDVNTSVETTPVASNPYTITPGPFTKLQLLVPGETAAPGTPSGKTGSPTAQTAGTAFNVTVNAVDAYWNLVNTVTDQVYLTSTDANAVLPATTALVAGTQTLSVTFKTAGTQTLTAVDSTDGTKTADTSPNITVSAGTPSKLVFTTSPVSGTASNTANLGPITVQTQDANGNPSNVAANTIVNLGSNSAGTYVFSLTKEGTAVTGVTIAAGSNSATFYYGDTRAGSPTIIVSATGLASATQTLTVTPAGSTGTGGGSAATAYVTTPAPTPSAPSGPAGAPKVFVGGKAVTFDVPPRIESGRTLVPVRAIMEALGATVEWNGAKRTVTVTRPGVKIVLTIGSRNALVNGRTVRLDVPARIVNDRTIIPLRFMSERLGEKVTWDPATRTVYITR